MRLRLTKFSIQNLSHMQLRVAWWHVPWPEHSFWHTTVSRLRICNEN